MGIARDEQERLLPTHRPAEGVDPAPVDVHTPLPRNLGHAGEVRYLTRRTPREPVQAASFARGVDQREAALAGQVAPEERVVALVDAAPVRRDDERDALAVVAGRQEH